MKNIQADNPNEDADEYFDPMTYDGITPKCICGYELIKEDLGGTGENITFRCTGGSHRYIMRQGDVVYDKFGRVMLKKPREEQ